jgi:hypothetical protein
MNSPSLPRLRITAFVPAGFGRGPLLRSASALTLALALLTLPACDDAEPIPAYLQIDTFAVDFNPTTEGSESSKITDVWVFIDGLFLGVYDLPATVPVLAAGEVEVRLEAGVLENGRSVTPNIYPFYESFVQTVSLVPGQTFPLEPVARYRNEAQFGFVEDFEANQPRIFTVNWFGERELTVTRDTVFEGEFSGVLRLDSNNPLVVIASEFDFTGLLNQTNPNVWLEIDYRSTATVAWGVVGLRGLAPVEVFDAGFLPSPTWNKIYLNIGQTIFNSDLEEYSIAFQAFLAQTGQTEATVFLDNIKLLYF